MSMLKIAVFLLCASTSLQAQEWIKHERIDVRPDGQASTSGEYMGETSISDDGRWVTFESRKNDLVTGDTNGYNDVFVRDRTTQTTRRINLLADGTEANYGGSVPHASRDGRFVSFYSEVSLIAEDTNYRGDVYLLDRDVDGNGIFDETGGTMLRRVSVDAAGAQIYYGARQLRSAVSDNGVSVAFATTVPIAPQDNNSKSDVYVRDLAHQTTPVMSINAAQTVGDNDSPGSFRDPLRISNDGRYVAFNSDATNLVPEDTNYKTDVFVHDRDSDGNGIFDEPGGTSIQRASLKPGSTELSSDVRDFDLDGSGRWVAFSYLGNIGDDNNPGSDIYLSNLANGTVTRINFNAAMWKKGDSSCCGNQYPLLSRDAGVVVFRSSQLYALPGGVTGSPTDVFSWTRGGGLKRVTNFVPPTGVGQGQAAKPLAISANGKHAVIQIVFDSTNQTFVYSRNTVFTGGFELTP